MKDAKESGVITDSNGTEWTFFKSGMAKRQDFRHIRGGIEVSFDIEMGKRGLKVSFFFQNDKKSSVLFSRSLLSWTTYRYQNFCQ